jgi:hypothetical protein
LPRDDPENLAHRLLPAFGGVLTASSNLHASQFTEINHA